MTITISPELEGKVREKAAAEGVSVEAYVEELIRREDGSRVECDPRPVDQNDPEFEEIRAAVMEGLDEFDRGESRPAREVFAELRTKYGFSR